MPLTRMQRRPIALTIAGSDSGGGAGIQTDLKTFASLAVHGTSVLTCITAQNPKQVLAVQPVRPALITAQFEALQDGLRPAAIKSGMLYSRAIVQAVITALSALRGVPYVLDPVMIATSGAALLRADCRSLIQRSLMPLARLITPNLPEAACLLGHPITSQEEARDAVKALADRFQTACLLKGGHLPQGSKVIDYLEDGKDLLVLEAPYQRKRQTHGTGCTYAAAITACLARSCDLRSAVQEAKAFISQAIAQSVRIGSHQALNPKP